MTALWIIQKKKLDCQRKFFQIIQLFYDNMKGKVLLDVAVSLPFNISDGVKQGCMLARVLFNLFFTCVLYYSIRDLDTRVYLRYQLDSSLFDLQHLAEKKRTLEQLISEALPADKCA